MAYEIAPDLNPNIPPNTHVFPLSEPGTVLTPRFDKFYSIHKATSWDLRDIPWHQIDQSRLTDDDVNGVLAAMDIESLNPVYVQTLLWMNRQDHEESAFTILWGEQELHHYLGLRMYALASGRVNPQDLDVRLESRRAGQWGKKERVLTPPRARTRTMMQEQVTGQFYQNFGANTHEPVLKRLLKFIEIQEFHHSGWSLEGAIILKNTDPHAIEEIEDELLNFEMPGPSFMEDYEVQGEALRKVANPGIKDFLQALGKVERLIGKVHLAKLITHPAYRKKLSDEWGMDLSKITNPFGRLSFSGS
ncbi:MAG: hypothetical protein ACD_30C00054G0009 [uncultured bacterium]|uniref:Ferritin-like domain-containing protein n=4 Tax=Candidatus Daviesiibacteriota TaxID=1752718 RepID=A0A0G0F1P9_9BACT|nr:MAG: hypothetical protein ACD_30C00054G0009 [uncultured bacterium]KKQ07540.1 MAG: hypothetical protein US19_C0043G0011 [Candidatus Daviesbacteria bacterium GW2011_GWB1_36_5]KKQ14849.1 MAG: hypothetical protein US28_C0028G0013 [Candidatus Daviesbacteria bacterium GW2011_GWA1_36_8]OGE16759.1 MAG: hypothetical protein A2858_04020 [Candidatus Daviesbacteria bacterium RIFCSPHIGHO2_01_FULL_36_37]OGE35294.1 MAG: hypothetical protein A3E66_00335 [Candidatus Daviesbacteria bacterium RIFCSPHIGHO2_12_F